MVARPTQFLHSSFISFEDNGAQDRNKAASRENRSVSRSIFQQLCVVCTPSQAATLARAGNG